MYYREIYVYFNLLPARPPTAHTKISRRWRFTSGRGRRGGR